MIDQVKLKKYQDYLQEMLVDFRNYCNANNLTWMLAGGSALGAIRHQGFIPWDDDVDLAMPRPDFEQLEHLMAKAGNKLGKYIYSPVEKQIVPEAPIGHLYYTEASAGRAQYAPKLDIHPLDGVPEDNKLRKKQKIQSLIYFLGIYHLPTKNKGKLMHTVTGITLKAVPEKSWKKIKRRAKRFFTSFSCYNSANICSIFGSAGYDKEIVPRSWLLPPVMTDFNGEKMPVPAQCEKYLERLYGDWSALPPEEDRHPVHDYYRYVR